MCKSDSDDLTDFVINEFNECISSDEELQDGEEESNESEDYSNTGTDSDFIAKPIQVLAPVAKASGPSDISHILTEGPKQPKLNFYRKTEFGVGNNKRWRSFSSSWIDTFPWLEYSVLNDAAFCFPCRFFSVKLEENNLFTDVGFKNWKKATEKNAGLKQHENSEDHKTCQVKWDSYKNLKSNENSNVVSISSQLNEAHAKLVSENRLYIKTICKCLLYTAVQGIAQRARDESQDSVNRGNFIELLDLVAEYNSVLADK